MRTNVEHIDEQCVAHRQKVSETIIEYIEKNGISVCRFSQLANISQSQIQLIIDGKTNPSMDMLMKISAVTGKSIEINALIETQDESN